MNEISINCCTATSLSPKMNGRSGTGGFEDSGGVSGGTIPGILPTSYIPPFLNILTQTTTNTIPSPTNTPYSSTQTTSMPSSASPSQSPNVATTAVVTITTGPMGPGSTSTPAIVPSTVPQGFTGSNHHAWGQMGTGVHAGILTAIVIGIFAIAGYAIWKRCGKGKGTKSSGGENGVLPMHTVQHNQSIRDPQSESQEAIVGGDAPPPRYEEVVPPQHQRLAGGISLNREEEEAGMVADGKTPVSEIPFEDVVLDHAQSESSSSQSFSMRHHTGGGDTTGHTNS